MYIFIMSHICPSWAYVTQNNVFLAHQVYWFGRNQEMFVGCEIKFILWIGTIGTFKGSRKVWETECLSERPDWDQSVVNFIHKSSLNQAVVAVCPVCMLSLLYHLDKLYIVRSLCSLHGLTNCFLSESKDFGLALVVFPVWYNLQKF